eukprot:TRINITY_DN67974_c4_g1_i1.p1 TRINITY_DN67974_c4_g1~~TRINITY_DN67974_c4_g1_i1.p1  ORF type:complete len:782 (-),score=78.64 TRINITY_DN67974_c4_g1_i1:515-2860(-)
MGTLLVVLTTLFISIVAGAELGQQYIDFAVTNPSEEAGKTFKDALAALFLFDPDCSAQFIAAQQQSNNKFPMAVWGEAMCSYDPLADTQDLDKGKRALLQLDSMTEETQKLTTREQNYITAVRALFSSSKPKMQERLAEYRSLMKSLVDRNPNDQSAKVLYAASLMATTRFRGYMQDITTRDQVISMVKAVLKIVPNHPLANVLATNLWDTPYSAYMAVEPATVLSRAAPDSAQAHHFASVPYIRLGQWPEAAQLLNSAVSKSNAAPSSYSLQLRNYVLLNQGKWAEANRHVTDLWKRDNALSTRVSVAYMEAEYLLFTEKWNDEDKAKMPTKLTPPSNTRESRGSYIWTDSAYASRLFMHGVAVAQRSDMTEANKVLLELQNLANTQATLPAEMNLDQYKAELATVVNQFDAIVLYFNGNNADAISKLSDLAATDLPKLSPTPAGPPRLPVWPLTECLGHFLYREKRYSASQQFYEQALAMNPNRSTALLGAARSAAALHRNKQAANYYKTLMDNWADGDAELPPMQEAQRFVAATNNPVLEAIGVNAGVALDLEGPPSGNATDNADKEEEGGISKSTLGVIIFILVILLVVLALVIALLACQIMSMTPPKEASRAVPGEATVFEQALNNSPDKSPTLYSPAYDTYDASMLGGQAAGQADNGGYGEHWIEQSPTSPAPLQSTTYNTTAYPAPNNYAAPPQASSPPPVGVQGVGAPLAIHHSPTGVEPPAPQFGSGGAAWDNGAAAQPPGYSNPDPQYAPGSPPAYPGGYSYGQGGGPQQW